ncbi:hypothetical protein Fleli_1023 [Bernardetia litoralis DSM 6794]|uniref:Uncharacterized protein n=1 Tax=Bernardetia litoralis (strain ATCC 23117 / DSM 6794 / NBRC 15988 / NCIMB 1366 / Fx l1 / Sio-4) TaxID=880071 RepID=I4AHN4_BERLS|nr:hypothetical protein [Bernardetia litoralis]AFM03469.1 hypothetical protein Fleli_1023 [Bernardetia litoralis DSM 6794]
MNSKSNDFMYLVRVVLYLIILILLPDQLIIFFQEPRAILPLYEEVARETNSLIGTCELSRIELLSNHTIPKELDITNQKFYLVSNFIKERTFLFFYRYKKLDNRYILYRELLDSDSLLMMDYIREKTPSIKYVRDSKNTRKFTPFVPSHLVEVSDISIEDSIKLDIVERYWKGDAVKLIGKITLVCNCEVEKR